MTDWSTLKKLIWLRIIKGGGSALRTVTGALIHVTNALALPAEALTVNVEPIQDLHGYDSPWPAGGGKNKLNLADGTGTATRGVTPTYNNDGGLVFTGTVSSVGFLGNYTLTNPLVLPAGTYTFSYEQNINDEIYFLSNWTTITSIAKTAISRTVTLSEETSINRICLGGNNVSVGDQINTNVKHIQIESGSTATAYAPYSNICPISGRTSATVTRTGKNLCPINTLDDVEWATENNDLLTFINGLANGTYNMAFKSTIKTLTDDTGYWVTGFVFTSPSGFVNNQANTNAVHSVGSVQTKNVSFVINDNNRGKFTHAYIYGAGNNQVGKTGTATITEIQVELGSTASAYEPYQGNTYTIQLGDTVYGGTLDVTGGKMVVDMAMVDMGTLNWSYNTTYAFFITQSLIDRKIGLTNMVSDLFKTDAGSWSGTPKTNAIWGNGSNATVYVQYPLTDVEDFLALVTGHQLVYELATPIEIILTPTQIDMLLGENNLWADAGDLTLTYYADGNASTSEALGILLGGTYNNPGSADDVSDDEALEILLGGS